MILAIKVPQKIHQPYSWGILTYPAALIIIIAAVRHSVLVFWVCFVVAVGSSILNSSAKNQMLCCVCCDIQYIEVVSKEVLLLLPFVLGL